MDKKKKKSIAAKRSARPQSKTDVMEEENTQKAQRKDVPPRAKNKPPSEEESTVSKEKKDKKAKTPSATTKGLSPEVETAVAAFLKHVTETPLEVIRAEHKTVCDAGGTPNVRPHPNQNKARYPYIDCIETTRVVIKSTETQAPTDEFVHASKVILEHSEREYIAAQAPKQDQIEVFWKMVNQEQAVCVLCLTPFAEDGETRCEEFWPMETNQYKYFGKMFLNNKKVELQEHYSVYTMEVLPEGCSNSFVTRLVHLVEWPDKGVGSSRALLKLSRWIKTLEKGPVVVMSSGGCGRPGTYIGIEVGLARLFKGHDTKLVELVTELRKQRALAVANELQYLFIYSTILDYVRAKMPKHVDKVNKFFKTIKDS